MTIEPRVPQKVESLKFEQMTFGYDPSRPIFANLELEIPTGRNVFVTGTEGSGMSSMLKLLAVMVQPQSGAYRINGQDTTEMSFEEFLPYRLRIGYTFDYGGLFANRTLRENLLLPLAYHKLCSHEEAESRVEAMAQRFGFTNQLGQRPAEVSGGLRKLVGVLRAFAFEPEMLVMDDPFSGVGAESARKLISLVGERREKGELKHVFLTSREDSWPHQLACDELFIDRGTIRFSERKVAA